MDKTFDNQEIYQGIFDMLRIYNIDIFSLCASNNTTANKIIYIALAKSQRGVQYMAGKPLISIYRERTHNSLLSRARIPTRIPTGCIL